MPARVNAVFFDIDGVILDDARTPLEWHRLIGDVLAPALGRAANDWGQANRAVIEGLLAAYPHDIDDPIASERQFAITWIRALCRELDLAPPDDDDATHLAMLAEMYVCSHTTAAFDGARTAIEALRPAYALHTATGNFSWRVDAVLTNLRVLDHFGVRFGPDRAGAHKASERFYERALAAAHVAPSAALFVDDNRGPLELAAALGAHTALIDPARPEAPFDLVLASIEELPAAIARL